MLHRPRRRPIASVAARLSALGLALAALMAAAPAPAAAGEAQGPVLVELFTSQGCSSCPPADALLAELADQPGVVALSLHVDYWDYLGWADAFAMPAFTRRQAAYGQAAGARSVYTPQVIVNGEARLVGSRAAQVRAAIAAAAAAPREARILISPHAEGLEVRVEPVAAPAASGVVWFVPYHSPPAVEIERGENAGRHIAYRNVARSWMKLGRWDGRAPRTWTAPAPGAGAGVAVIVQRDGVGPVIAAAAYDR